MKKWILGTRCPKCGGVVRAVALNYGIDADTNRELVAELEGGCIPFVCENPEKNFDWCDCDYTAPAS